MKDARDTGSITVSERSLEAGNSNPLQYSCLENPTNRRALQATVHGLAKVRNEISTKHGCTQSIYLHAHQSYLSFGLLMWRNGEGSVQSWEESWQVTTRNKYK